MRKKIILVISTILPYFLVFFASIYRPFDADLGWHLKYGEYFVQTGEVLRDNTFATEMADFKWANIAWGTDVLTYLLYSLGGFFALSIATAIVVTVTFFFFAKAFRLDYWQKALIFPFLLFLQHPVNQISWRGQLLSMLFLGIFFYFLERYRNGNKYAIYAVPIVFGLWANIHGQFILGLGILSLWTISVLSVKFYKERTFSSSLKRETVTLGIVALLSFLLPVIHPFGIQVYYDALIHFHNPLLLQIAEYVPHEELSLSWLNHIGIAVVICIGIITLFIKKQLILSTPLLIITVFLYILSLSVKRYTWTMYFVAIPLIKPTIDFLRPPGKYKSFLIGTVVLIVCLFVTVVLKYPFDQYRNMNWDIYCAEYYDCSSAGVKALEKYYIPGKTMTLYNWGGYLIWNYPQIKPSTDGRMHLWEDEKGYSAFRHDYNIEQNISDVQYSKYEVVYTSKAKPIAVHLEELAREGKWKQVYNDRTSVIYTRLP